MGIVKLALIVLAMVFSAAPLPFSDQLGPEALHVVWAGSTLFYLLASDYFHVVRLKGYVEFWRTFRGDRRSRELVATERAGYFSAPLARSSARYASLSVCFSVATGSSVG